MPEMDLEDVQQEVKQFTVDLKTLRDESLSAWEQFKKENDARLAQLESKGAADPLLSEKVDKLGSQILTQQQRVDQLSATLTRFNQSGANNTHSDAPPYAQQFFQTYASYRTPGVRIRPEDVNLQAYADYKHAWASYLHTKDDKVMHPDEYKALQAGSAPDGGYLVRPELSDRIIQAVFESSPMRQLATVEQIGTMTLEILVDIDDIAVGIVGETAPRPETGTPQWRMKQISVYEMYAKPLATQILLEDAIIDVERWLLNKLSAKFARKEAQLFISGTGTGEPKGILTYPAGTAWGQVQQVPSGNATALTPDGLIDLAFSLKEPYYANATFLMNRRTIASVMKFKDQQQQYLWQPNYQSGQPATLVGFPVRFASDMPNVAAGTLPVAFGDFRAAYTIVDRIGMSVLRDPYSSKPYVEFYTRRRVGGDVVNTEAYALQVVSL